MSITVPSRVHPDVPSSTLSVGSVYAGSSGYSSFVTSTISGDYFGKRDDDDDDESSSSSSSDSVSSKSKKSSSTLCGGEKCKFPTDHSYSTTVGVAVGVPVGVILFIFVVILGVLYRKKKKDEKDDNDPDFFGDAEFMPDMNKEFTEGKRAGRGYGYRNISKQRYSSRPATHGDIYNIPNVNDLEFMDFKNDKDDVAYFDPGNTSSNNPFVNPSQRNLLENQGKRIPTYLPENIDSMALRDYANNIDGPADLGAYKLASRNHSQVSLTSNVYASSNNNSNVNLPQTKRDTQTREIKQIYSNNTSGNRESRLTNDGNDRSMSSQIMSSPVKSVIGHTTQHYGKDVSGYDIETSRLDNTNDFTFESETDRNSKILPEDNYQMQEVNFAVPADEEVEEDKNIHNVTMDPEDKVYQMGTEEDENIKRLKSIYNVYLDRNDTVKQVPEPELPDNMNYDSQHNENPFESNLLAPQDSEVQPEQSNKIDDNTINEQDNSKSHRAVSSIYSEFPLQSQNNNMNRGTNISMRNDLNTGSYNNGYGQPPVNAAQHDGQYSGQYNGNYEGQYNNSQYNNNYNNYDTYQQPMLNQFSHPQTHEPIAELPTPTKLAYAQSSHSLTSFSSQAKQQFNNNRLRPHVENGTVLNPVDHPEMFYKQGPDQNSSYQQMPTSEDANATLQPHQLRESVVMTDPHSLGAPKTFKPAGSFRNMSNSNSRNNSLTMQNNPNYPAQAYNNRVSGLIDHGDIAQPPSVGNILPHSSSNDDLRKQISGNPDYQFS